MGSGRQHCRLQRQFFRKGEVIIDPEDVADRPGDALPSEWGMLPFAQALHSRVWLRDGAVWRRGEGAEVLEVCNCYPIPPGRDSSC